MSPYVVPAPFPHPPEIEIGGRALQALDVIERLEPYLSARRRTRIAEVVAARTYSIVPVLEGVHDLGNVNAVLRSAEGLGCATAHLASLQGDAATWARHRAGRGLVSVGLRAAQRQSQGADKWLDLHVWTDVAECLAQLRVTGYRIAATHLGADAVPIEDVDFAQPTAIVLGNEADGISARALAEADINIALPIDGFIQSYNVSVAAALVLYHARLDRVTRLGRHGDLTPEQQEVLTAMYYVRAASHAEALLSA